jgi:hypothetical protein
MTGDGDCNVKADSGHDCYDILAQSFIGLIKYPYHQGIPSFLETQR